MKITLTSIFFLFFLFQSSAQEIRLSKGTVTDSIPIVGSTNDTYEIYLPTSYSSDKEWPLLMIFDSEGRAKNTLNLFRTAAEEQGYILASPNLNLKTRSADSIVKTATDMMFNLFSAINIDKSQVFAAGMAEGAQVASTIPLFYKDLAGVMAIGNSFVNPKYLNKSHPYTFIGMAGRKDYMLYEIEAYLRFYDNIDYPTYVYYFDGQEDEWPAADVVTNAVSGFTLQAMKNGNRPAVQESIKELYQNELAIVNELVGKRKFYDAYEKLDRIKDKYGEFGFEDEVNDKMKEIKRYNGFRQQRRDFRQAVSDEKYQQDEYQYLLRTDVMTTNFENIGWWAYQMDELNKLKKSSNEAKSDMAYRLQGYLDFVSKRQFDQIIDSDLSIRAKIFISVLRTAIEKDDPEAYLKIIELAGGDGDYETALLYLEDLLKLGYSDYEALYDIPGILDLKLSKEYNDIIKKYFGTSKYNIKDPESEKS